MGGAGDHELEAFAAHHLDEDGELELAAAEDLEALGGAGVFDADGDVGEELALEALLDVAGGDELAFSTGEGRVVDGEDDGDGGIVDLDGREGLGIFEGAEAFTDGDAGDAGDGDDVADLGLDGIFALEAMKGEELGDLDGLEGAVELGEVDLLAVFERAVEDAGDGEAAEVVGVVEVGDEDLEVAVGAAGGGGDGLEDKVEERLEVGAWLAQIHGGGAGLAVGVDDGELEDGLVGVEVDEEVVDLVEDLLGAGVGTIDLVDDDDGSELGLEGLGEDVAGLGEGALGGVNEEDDAVDHLEGALDLAAEVGVSGGVDDVDLGLGTAGVVVLDGGVLGEDGDAALPFRGRWSP